MTSQKTLCCWLVRVQDGSKPPFLAVSASENIEPLRIIFSAHCFVPTTTLPILLVYLRPLPLAWARSDAATDFSFALLRGSRRISLAFDATLADVCFLFAISLSPPFSLHTA